MEARKLGKRIETVGRRMEEALIAVEGEKDHLSVLSRQEQVE